MKLYRVRYSQDGGNSAGFSWHASREAARRAAAAYWKNYRDEEKPDITAVEIVATKTGILDALNRYAEHPDNG